MAEDRVDQSSEVESQIPVEQLGLPSEIPPQTLSMLRNILEALAHEDAIKIFYYAKDGITNSTVAIRELGLTQKRYYTRLKLLLEAGLLEKWEQGYRYTFLGSILYQMGGRFGTIIENKDRLELANKLEKTKNLSLEEKQGLMKLIAPTESGGLLNIQDMISPVRIVDNYEDLIKNMIDMIDHSEEVICIASKYHDVRVIEAITRALQRSIKIRVLTEGEGLTNRINMLKALLSPRVVAAFLKAAKEFSAIIRKMNISYSFMILDEKWAVIEVPNPSKDTFYIAFIFQNVGICKSFSTIFNNMWEKGENVLLL